MNCKEIKDSVRIDAFLAKMGLQPAKTTAKGLWYISPITGEVHPSFEVSSDGRMFHDWSSGAKGTIIDLYLAIYSGSTIRDALIGLSSDFGQYLSSSPFHPHRQQASTSYIGGLSVVAVRHDICRKLQGYAYGRGVRREVLRQYCTEVEYINAGRYWYSLGFKNDKGGYEIRSHSFKGCSAPKSITSVGVPRACPYLVFEGFFDFLSAVQLGWFRPEVNNAVILNSTSMIEEGIAALRCATRIVCFLDNDASGKASFQKIADVYPAAEDYSFSFLPAKDLNERLTYLMNNSKIRG